MLHLIDKDKVNIYDIPIAQITAQYLDYIKAMQSLDLELASEFLVMAATLVAIKARMLLPKKVKGIDIKGDEGPDPREELVQRLIEYKKFKEAALYLKNQEKQIGKTYVRNNNAEMYQHLFRPRDPLNGVSMDMLLTSLQQILKRVGTELSIPSEITGREIQVPEKMRQVSALLLLYPKGVNFAELLEAKELQEIIVTFLAVLELLRLGQVAVRQEDVFGDITLLPVTFGQEEW